MTSVLQRLLASDLADLRGAVIKAVLPVPESLLNEVANQQIAASRGRIKQFDIQIGSGNYLQLGVQASVGPFTRWFRPEIIVATQAPVIVFTFASPGYAGLVWLAELFAKELLPKGVRITGRRIELDLRDVPQLAPYRNMLAYLKTLDVTSRQGTLLVSFDFRID